MGLQVYDILSDGASMHIMIIFGGILAQQYGIPAYALMWSAR
jgi:hypothetical protein